MTAHLDRFRAAGKQASRQTAGRSNRRGRQEGEGRLHAGDFGKMVFSGCPLAHPGPRSRTRRRISFETAFPFCPAAGTETGGGLVLEVALSLDGREVGTIHVLLPR